jgi:hypothetical protein
MHRRPLLRLVAHFAALRTEPGLAKVRPDRVPAAAPIPPPLAACLCDECERGCRVRFYDRESLCAPVVQGQSARVLVCGGTYTQRVLTTAWMTPYT